MEQPRLLEDKLGSGIYGAVGLRTQLNVFPTAVRDALLKAMSMTEEGKFAADSPEAEKIIDEAITALGYRRISSTDDSST